MTSTTEQGKEFEEAVAALLESTGLHVTREKDIRGKKVDLYYEDYDRGTKRRFAVECKHYRSRLQRDDVVNIYTGYETLLRREIDIILILTQNGVSPAAQAYIDDRLDLQHITYDLLQNEIMDFTSYLTGIIDQYSSEGLPSYYVRPQTVEEGDLQNYVDTWLTGENCNPIAVLGTYGMGKTSFARHIASGLAHRIRTSSKARIPILIPLGEISSEQTLEGLLGKALTATSLVRGYSFPTFMRLNELGRFLILLDGFDEMKFALDETEFEYNFEQLNRLVRGQSRIILFGRPNALMSDEEQSNLLRGERTIQGRTILNTEWPRYITLTLAPFDQNQVEEFLINYFKYKSEHSMSRRESLQVKELLKDELPIDIASKLSDIATRPVQLRMLADLLPQWKSDITDLSLTQLYSTFIDMVIEREVRRRAGRGGRDSDPIGKKGRREFAREIAWWLWTQKREMAVKASDIPSALFERNSTANIRDEALRREMVSACFLDRKLGSTLYFPHRSFQEFLVAERLATQVEGFADIGNANISTMGSTESMDALHYYIREVDAILTHDVAMFWSGLLTSKQLRWFDGALQTYRGALSEAFISLFARNPIAQEYALTRSKSCTSPWYPRVLSVAGWKSWRNGWTTGEVFDVLLARVSSLMRHTDSESPYFAASCWLDLLILVAHDSELPPVRRAELLANFTELLRVFTRNWAGYSKDCEVINRLLGSIFVETVEKDERGARIELRRVIPLLIHMLSNYCFVSGWTYASLSSKYRVNLPLHIYSWGYNGFMGANQGGDALR